MSRYPKMIDKIPLSCEICGTVFTVILPEYNDRIRKSKSKKLFCTRKCGLTYARSKWS